MPPPPKKELPASPMSELASAWSAWREEIPDDERVRVAEIVGAASIDSKPGINKLAQAILVEVFKGTLSPVVLEAARPWMEMIIFNIDSMNQTGGVRGTAMDTVAFLADLRNQVKPVQPMYIVDHIPNKTEIIEHDKEGVIDAVKVR